ncbi:hypothetical protein [Streptomyces sp. NBC_00859]|uniref:hypothetical protein n=1 Tax=Streptomyces sp. NBC_00859 TaxID=2903682 RepID=UPI00386E2702|nr:hypothetical protein OG584_14330 [Streptomyces sp. NBC_00859]
MRTRRRGAHVQDSVPQCRTVSGRMRAAHAGRENRAAVPPPVPAAVPQFEETP